MTSWTIGDIPSQVGRTAVITGTGGLAYEIALALARAGARVILAGRNEAQGAASVQRIRASLPSALIEPEPLDLSNLASIRGFATRMRASHDRLDLLINNAGVMTPPTREVTADGLELQLGTNHLGHFALTAQLLPLLKTGDRPRVISLGSVAARRGRIDFDDLNSERSYVPMAAYARSKLACLMFAFELQRRSAAAGWGIDSIAAHPGIARTNLLHNAPGKKSPQGRARTWLWFLFQPVAQGALPVLFAATDPHATPGGYVGPAMFWETRGHPGPARIPPAALDGATAARLWEESERLTRTLFC